MVWDYKMVLPLSKKPAWDGLGLLDGPHSKKPACDDLRLLDGPHPKKPACDPHSTPPVFPPVNRMMTSTYTDWKWVELVNSSAHSPRDDGSW